MFAFSGHQRSKIRVLVLWRHCEKFGKINQCSRKKMKICRYQRILSPGEVPSGRVARQVICTALPGLSERCRSGERRIVAIARCWDSLIRARQAKSRPMIGAIYHRRAPASGESHTDRFIERHPHPMIQSGVPEAKGLLNRINGTSPAQPALGQVRIFIPQSHIVRLTYRSLGIGSFSYSTFACAPPAAALE